MPPPTKLYVKKLPTLRGSSPSAKDTALWLLRLRRWSVTHGMEAYMFETPPAATTEDTLMTTEAMRYLDHAIENEKLAGDLADQCANAFQAITRIRQQWLTGQSENIVLEQELLNVKFTEGDSLPAFLADFALMVNHIRPIMPASRSTEEFATNDCSTSQPRTLVARTRHTRPTKAQSPCLSEATSAI